MSSLSCLHFTNQVVVVRVLQKVVVVFCSAALQKVIQLILVGSSTDEIGACDWIGLGITLD